MYEVEEHLRVHDVIQLAGGFLEMANETAINLAQKISDEMVIYVPHLDEEINNTSLIHGVLRKMSKESLLIQATTGDLETHPVLVLLKRQLLLNIARKLACFNRLMS